MTEKDQDYIKEQWPIGREFEFLGVTHIVSEHAQPPCDDGVGCFISVAGRIEFTFLPLHMLKVIDIAHQRRIERNSRSMEYVPLLFDRPQS